MLYFLLSLMNWSILIPAVMTDLYWWQVFQFHSSIKVATTDSSSISFVSSTWRLPNLMVSVRLHQEEISVAEVPNNSLENSNHFFTVMKILISRECIEVKPHIHRVYSHYNWHVSSGRSCICKSGHPWGSDCTKLLIHNLFEWHLSARYSMQNWADHASSK